MAYFGPENVLDYVEPEEEAKPSFTEKCRMAKGKNAPRELFKRWTQWHTTKAELEGKKRELQEYRRQNAFVLDQYETLEKEVEKLAKQVFLRKQKILDY